MSREARLSGQSEQDLAKVLRQSAESSERLVKENADLKARLERAEAAAGKAPQDYVALEQKFQALEAENREFANRYVEIEEENNNLANLYVASYQLHSTLDFREVLQIITEIAINLIGAECFAIYLVDDKTRMLTSVASEGLDKDKLPKVALGQGIIGKVAESGDNHFGPEEQISAPVSPTEPFICIPLKIKDRIIGVIALYAFLKQKTRLASVDYELFTLLAGHAATALFSSKLYSESERKLSTIQGFLELMTS
jgi:transcriptional regulator with GAF, ATPase, and Fis domain